MRICVLMRRYGMIPPLDRSPGAVQGEAASPPIPPPLRPREAVAAPGGLERGRGEREVWSRLCEGSWLCWAIEGWGMGRCAGRHGTERKGKGMERQTREVIDRDIMDKE